MALLLLAATSAIWPPVQYGHLCNMAPLQCGPVDAGSSECHADFGTDAESDGFADVRSDWRTHIFADYGTHWCTDDGEDQVNRLLAAHSPVALHSLSTSISSGTAIDVPVLVVTASTRGFQWCTACAQRDIPTDASTACLSTPSALTTLLVVERTLGRRRLDAWCRLLLPLAAAHD